MIGLLAIVAVGFLLGIRHAADPDHVIAVSTIVSREVNMKRASLIGAAWGVGHTLTILLVGSALIGFRVVLPPRLGLAMELAVGLMLIFLGLKNLRGLLAWSAQRGKTDPDCRLPERIHYHSHGDYIHAHLHAQENGHAHDPRQNPVAAMDRLFRRSEVYRCLRPLVIGVVHGLAGSAAIALLVLTTISSPGWAVAYLAVFGVGTVLGMMLITLMMGSTFAYAQKRFARIGQHFSWAAGVVSLVFGLFLAYQVGFVNGLFSSHVQWVPR
jgi:ABC-type nickel/cobalt efflux system permease component RcnA